jgi:hypothetical protein
LFLFKPDNMKEKERKSEVSKRSQQDKKNTNEDTKKPLPGEYPPNEDIMNRQNTTRVSLDVENFSRTLGPENYNKPNEPLITEANDVVDPPLLATPEDPESHAIQEMEWPVPKDLKEDEDEFAIGNESDVTPEDLEALGPKDLSMDMGEDEELLKNRVWPVDMAGKDLDVPGAELDDETEAIGSEDEENNSYSLGGDRLEDNMEGK